MYAADHLYIDRCTAAITEIGARRDHAADLAAHLRGRGMELPPVGCIAIEGERLLLGIRPERWLLIASPAAVDAMNTEWHRAGAVLGGVVDLSAAYAVFLLRGSRIPEVLARGCRLDLEPQSFPTGHAAATIIAQTPVCMASLPAGMLLLAPASLGRHFNEWLNAAASTVAPMPQSLISVAELCRSSET